MEDLLQASDPDLLAFISDEGNRLDRREQFLMRAASEVVRDYCGWHIAPPVTDTYDKLEIGSNGLIMLPSLHVTDVAAVSVTSGDEVVALTTVDYDWFRQGYIEANSPVWRYGTGIYNGPYKTGLVSVTMTHGYDTCPLPVKSVVFELMQSAVAVSSGNVKQARSSNYSITWGGPGGLIVSPEQMGRLASYRIGGLK